MTSTALPDPAPSSPVRVRRPPSPDGALATVTQLGPAIDRRDTVPLASVQGTLALDLTGEPAPCPFVRTPPRRPPTCGWSPASHRRPRAAGVDGTVRTGGRGGARRPPAGQPAAALDEPAGLPGPRPAGAILSRATPTPPRLRTVRPQVRSVHVFRPGPRSRRGQRARQLRPAVPRDRRPARAAGRPVALRRPAAGLSVRRPRSRQAASRGPSARTAGRWTAARARTRPAVGGPGATRRSTDPRSGRAG